MIKKLIGSVKHYPWGGFDFLPQFLGRTNAEQKPWAEYWLGVHPLGMATTPDQITLRNYLSSHNVHDLSFLTKILDVRNMLSIQVHPTKEIAEEGYARENSAGIALDAFERTYKDDNHKPELMVALSEFWLVQGFKSTQELVQVFNKNQELSSLLPHLLHGGLKALFTHIITTDQEEINSLLKPLGKRIKRLYERGELAKSTIDYWAAKSFLTFNRKGFCDRGILSLYLMNLIRLSPGEGIFQAPGVLHAYLEGQNIECMANSDNVIRGGLTQKLIDHQELLRVVQFESNDPQVIHPVEKGDGTSIYSIPVNEFQMRVFRQGEAHITNDRGSMLAICIDGMVDLIQDGRRERMGRGEAAIIIGEFDLHSENPSGCQLFLTYQPRS